MKYLKKYNESLDKATYLRKCREIANDLEIYSEDLPFEMGDWTVDYVDAESAAQLNNANELRNVYAEGFVVSYEHKDTSLNHLIETPVTGNWGLNKMIAKARQDADKFFTRFAKKYDMEYKFISIEIDFDDDVDWVTAVANGDLDRDLMIIDIEFCLQMPKSMKYLKSQNEAIEDSSGSMVDQNRIDYNVSKEKLKDDLEVFAEDLPFDMSDIIVEPVRGIKLGGSYWYYDVTFKYNSDDMNDVISNYLFGTVNLDGYVDVSDEPILWLDTIKAQCNAAMSKFARKYDLELITNVGPLKALIDMDETENHKITYNVVFKKKR